MYVRLLQEVQHWRNSPAVSLFWAACLLQLPPSKAAWVHLAWTFAGLHEGFLALRIVQANPAHVIAFLRP